MARRFVQPLKMILHELLHLDRRSDPIFLRFNVKKGSELNFDERNQGVFVKTNEGGEAPFVKKQELLATGGIGLDCRTAW